MKPVKNKRHQNKYYPLTIYKIDVEVYCDIGDGTRASLTLHPPLKQVGGGNLSRRGAEIQVGNLKIPAKFFKETRQRM